MIRKFSRFVLRRQGASKAAARARFDEMDADHNNKISRKEARQWVEKTLGKKWYDRIPERGKASADQIFKREFARMDVDRNGVVTPGELDRLLE